MTTYRPRFEEKLAIIQPAVDDLPARIDELIPGISRPEIKRFFQRFSVLFGRIDKDGAKNPAFLSYEDGNIPEYIIDASDGIVDSLRAGPDNFFSTWMPTLVLLRIQLERAVGTSADEMKYLTSAVGDELRTAVSRSEEGLARIRSLTEEAGVIHGDIRQAQSEARKSSVSATEALEAIQALRSKLEKLASTDGRNKDSLEALVKSVRGRADAATEILDTIDKSQSQAEESINSIASHLDKAKSTEAELDQIRDKAAKILDLSSQAGLAGSYLKESSTLKNRANFFTTLLYLTALATIAVAAFYVIPSLEHVLTKDHNTLDAIPIALLRTTILAPLVYVFYFTTKQINSIETLRMDYAEKAAASLAYSGYKDEMSEDGPLLEQLRASLLLRFAEHPERLLRKRPSQEKLEVEAPGFKATASTADYPKTTTTETDGAE